MHRLLLIALGVNILFGNMCTMAFAHAMEMDVDCAMHVSSSTIGRCAEGQILHARPDCSDGSCFIVTGTEVRSAPGAWNMSLGAAALPVPTPEATPTASPLVSEFEPDMERPPPGPSPGIVMLQ